MPIRTVRGLRRRTPRLCPVVNASVELLELRLLLSTYTVTSAADSGPGTLRDAIANSSADTIAFNITGPILLDSQLEITRNLTVSGPGAAVLSVSGQDRTRVFQIDAGATAAIDELTITAGRAADGASGPAGELAPSGANGGAILNAGRLSLANDTVTGNVAGMGGQGVADANAGIEEDGGPGGNGGAIYNTGSLVITNSTLTGNAGGAGGTGSAMSDAVRDSGAGGTGGSGGAIYNDTAGTVELDDDMITNNGGGAGGLAGTSTIELAGGSGSGGPGGGVYNAGMMVVSGGTISGNKAGSGADGRNSIGSLGGAGGDGGGFFNSSTLRLIHVTIDGNTAGNGGAGGSDPANFGGDGGDAGFGGGVLSTGALAVSGCVLFANAGGAGGAGGQGAGGGGGMGGLGGFGGGIDCGNQSAVVIINTTITGNFGGAGGAGGESTLSQDGSSGDGGDGAQGGSGAGIDCASTAIVMLTNATIAGNTPGPGGKGGRTADPFGLSGSDALPGVGAGIAFTPYVPGGDVTIYNTICDDIFGPLDTRLAAGQQPSSNNLIGAGGSGGLVNGTRGNIVGATDLKLGPLANHGGPTQTMALLAGSPALDHGSSALASDARLTTDQRGFARVFNGAVDIGAYEAQPPAAAGDVNHDGTTAFADLLLLAQHYGSAQPLFEGGDLNGDGSVSFADLLLLAQNYGKSSPATAFDSLRAAAKSRLSSVRR